MINAKAAESPASSGSSRSSSTSGKKVAAPLAKCSYSISSSQSSPCLSHHSSCFAVAAADAIFSLCLAVSLGSVCAASGASTTS